MEEQTMTENTTTIIDYTLHFENIEMILLYLLATNVILTTAILVLIFFVAKGDSGK